VVLLPPVIKPRLESSPIDGVRDFERSMGILANTRHGSAQTRGRWVMLPKDLEQAPRRRRNRVIRRRRQNFLRLIGLAFTTLVLGIVPGWGFFLIAHLGVDLVLAVYIVQLRRWHKAEIQREQVVRELPSEEQKPPETERKAAGH
jgi:hypothetical protein